MSTASSIEWTDTTWNPVTGCDRISAGCDHCYALTMARRLKTMGQPRYQTDGHPTTSGPGFGVSLHPEALTEPLRWRTPRRVFVNSMSDLFHARVPASFVAAVWYAMGHTGGQTAREHPVHTYQVLTKRPQRMARWLRGWSDPEQRPVWVMQAHDRGWLHGFPLVADPAAWVWQWDDVLPNVWLGTSIEHARVLHRLDALRATPAAVRFLSCEPLIGPLPDLDLAGIDWVIIGGESGPGARPMELAWAHDLIRQCEAAQVAVFVKQLGTVTGRALDAGGKGGDWTRWPAELRVRQYPRAAADRCAWAQPTDSPPEASGQLALLPATGIPAGVPR